MQMQASQQHLQLSRIAGIAIVLSCATIVATLLASDPFSIGSANAAPAKVSVTPAQAAGAKEAAADPAHGSRDSPTRPNCAALGRIAGTQEGEGVGESAAAVGCGARNNVAGSKPASNQSQDQLDVTTLLAWHVQARNLMQRPRQTTLLGQSWAVATEDRQRRN